MNDLVKHLRETACVFCKQAADKLEGCERESAELLDDLIASRAQVERLTAPLTEDERNRMTGGLYMTLGPWFGDVIRARVKQ